MAKLVNIRNLTVGRTYFEDCVFGTEPNKIRILEQLDEKGLHYRAQYVPDGVVYTIRPNRDYRFWDSEPSYEDREFTKWNY